MRILYITTGGAPKDTDFLKGILDSGHELHYVSMRTIGLSLSVEGAYNYCLDDEIVREDSWLKSTIFKHFLTFLKFRKLVKTIQPDIIHAGVVQGPGLMAVASGFKNILLMPWGSDILIHPKRSILFRSITKFVLKRVKLITCDAETVKNEILNISRIPEERIKVIPWGVNIENFKPSPDKRAAVRKELGLKNENLVLIMTRWFRAVYAIEDFLSALPEVIQNNSNAVALLAGSGPLENNLRQKTKELGIENNVIFLGSIPNESLPRYLNAADLYVSTSLSDGTSISLLEAMACELPVVVTDIKANAEWINDNINGYITPIKNPKILTNTLINAIKNKNLWQNMGHANRALVIKKANWKNNFSEIESLYNQINL